MKNLAIILVSILALQSCNEGTQEINQNKASHTEYKHDFKNEKFSFNAQKATVIVTKRGNKLKFKPNSFVDKMGNVIKGNVQINFTEYTNPVDFFLSKINMQYDSNGTEYTFRSNGMFKILGSQNQKEIYINPSQYPTIAYKKVIQDNRSYSLYSYDSLSQKWKNENKLKIIAKVYIPKLPKLFKPQKQDSTMIPINFLVDYSQLPDLKPYKNLKFVFHPSNHKRYSRLGTIIWDNIAVKKSNTKNQYIIQLTKGTKKDSLIAFPAFSDEVYQKAKAVYDKEIEAYNKSLAQIEKKKEDAKKAEIRNEYTNMSINRFGTWNHDLPKIVTYKFYNLTLLNAQNHKIEFPKINVAYEDFNGVFLGKPNNIRLAFEKSIMIWETKNDSLFYAYITQSVINTDTPNNLTIVMQSSLLNEETIYKFKDAFNKYGFKYINL